MTTGSRSDFRSWEWPCILILIVVLGTAFAVTQPRVTADHAHDGAYYVVIAQQLRAGSRPEAVAPFVSRVGTSWLAVRLQEGAGVSFLQAFFIINLLASSATAVLFGWWLRDHVDDAVTRVTLVAFFLVAPYSPFRFTFYYPQLTDPIAMLFLMVGLVLLDRLARNLAALPALALAATVAVGCVFRELALMPAMAAIFVRPWTAKLPRWLWRAVPVAGVASLVAVHSWVKVTPSSYSLWFEMKQWIMWKTPAMLAVAALFVFGPLSVLILQHWRTTWRTALRRPDLVVFAAVFIAAGWLAASDTERIFEFAVPVILMLIGTPLAGTRRGARNVFAAIVVLQLLAYRVFVPIAGRSLPFFSEHYSFYTTWAEPVALYSFLVLNGIGMMLIFFVTRSAPFIAEPEPTAAVAVRV